MALTSAFFEAVHSGNVRLVRIMMKDSLLVDPTFQEFKEMENAANSMRGLYDRHDGRKFITDKKDWDDNYMDKLMVQVVSNFSHERVEHLKAVVRQLRPNVNASRSCRTPQASEEGRTHDASGKNKQNNYEEQKRLDQREGVYLGAKVAAGAAAGAVAGGVVASLAGAPIIGGVAAGAVAGGVVVSVAVNGGR